VVVVAMENLRDRYPRSHSSNTDRDSTGLFNPEDDPNAIVTSAPESRFKLGYWSVMALVVNRMIGTGIFMAPTTVIKVLRVLDFPCYFGRSAFCTLLRERTSMSNTV